MTVFVQDVQQLGPLVMAPHVIAPHTLVDEIMEVKIFQMLELCACGGEQFFTNLHMRIHGAANIQKQQDLYRIVPLRHHFYIQKACIAGCRTDRVIQIQLFGRAGASELSQASQGNFDVARTQLNGVIQIFEVAFVPDLYGLLVASIWANTNTFGVISLLSKR